MGLFIPPLPRITLLGAGPGDPELLTIKGMKALQSADVVLYDALVNPELLNHAPAGARRLYVGKRCSAHSLSQPEINDLLVQSALDFGHAVRLKGGDPFVFGRGGEEVLAAREAGIAVNVIPGVSSALAVPALAGVPLTHRGVSRSFWIMTGTSKDHKIPAEIAEAAATAATCVILMGTRKIKEICAVFLRHRAGDTPIALLQNGSLPESRATIGSISDPTPLELAAKASGPGILVIGEVVRFREAFPAWAALSQPG
ncbi:uroporphyrinogen-III C-methyltransferase [Neolewinella aurantiaca]|uniref:uroporphyrinogen-III C-methyltransferase n=1 Tax=Neolewinella aurantiaca TaxID=2602767 RepID=A0A5C7FWT6_9BACT|nr:uroporphyrinogen-III C-methyltransferase [Neolewinella aurantiaca]TXF90900.1 uroporphyrinogen-III C-methyltransferase [Neolewinella aurantiaca]